MPADLVIRDFVDHADYAACVELQRDIWGRTFTDVVPPSILKVSQLLGGVAAGAFAPDGTLVGFVYGMTGLRAGALVHWSDMLAVRPGAQGQGIGRRLKEHQRASVRARGIESVYWTFDPLVARNAHLNLAVLGATIVEYVEDMYGDTGSDLHRGLGTDRLVARWPTDLDASAERAAAARAAEPRFVAAPVANAAPGTSIDDRPYLAATEEWRRAPRIRIVVPSDVTLVQRDAPELGAAWRMSTRAAFRAALDAGYAVAGISAPGGDALAYYLLERDG